MGKRTVYVEMKLGKASINVSNLEDMVFVTTGKYIRSPDLEMGCGLFGLNVSYRTHMEMGYACKMFDKVPDSEKVLEMLDNLQQRSGLPEFGFDDATMEARKDGTSKELAIGIFCIFDMEGDFKVQNMVLTHDKGSVTKVVLLLLRLVFVVKVISGKFRRVGGPFQEMHQREMWLEQKYWMLEIVPGSKFKLDVKMGILGIVGKEKGKSHMEIVGITVKCFVTGQCIDGEKLSCAGLQVKGTRIAEYVTDVLGITVLMQQYGNSSNSDAVDLCNLNGLRAAQGSIVDDCGADCDAANARTIVGVKAIILPERVDCSSSVDSLRQVTLLYKVVWVCGAAAMKIWG